MVAQEQRRFAEAEASYRQALDIYRELDPEKASMVATRLGLLLSELDRHTDAAAMLLDGALLWYQLAGKWDTEDLQYLMHERQVIGDAGFRQIVTEIVGTRALRHTTHD